MQALPPLQIEDVEVFDKLLSTLLHDSDATAAMLVDQGGPIIAQVGDAAKLDTTSLAALAAGAFAATQAVAQLVGEPEFSHIYQQGKEHSVLVSRVNDCLLIVVIFKASLSAGMIKFCATASVPGFVRQVEQAAARSPGRSVDLVSLDLTDPTNFFRRKE